MLSLRHSLLFSVALILASCSHRTEDTRTINEVPRGTWEEAIAELRSRLMHDGITPTQLLPLEPKGVVYRGRAVKWKLLNICQAHPEIKIEIDDRAIDRGKRFMKDHAPAFKKANDETGVPPQVIASILWVETKFGQYSGRHPALPTIASLAALGVPHFGEEVARRMIAVVANAKKESPEKGEDPACWDKVDWSKRIGEVGSAWYEELKAFLILADMNPWKITEINGSWAGALGYGQFLPTTALRNMLTGETILADLWNWDDTIRLIARHLAENGWSKEASAEQQREAVFNYNRANAYVDGVLKMATFLRPAKK